MRLNQEMLIGFVYLCCVFVLGQMSEVQAVPPDWTQLEKGQWHDLITGYPHVRQLHCDPGIPGCMYGLASNGFENLYPTHSTDYGRTWSPDPGEINTQLGPLISYSFQRVWFSPENQKVFWLMAQISLWDGVYQFLLKRHSLSESWQVVLNCNQEFDIPLGGKATNFAVKADGKLFVQYHGNVWVSDDFGGTWRQTFFEGRGHPYDYIEFSPHSAETIYISNNYNLECMLWRSHDNGESWQSMNFDISLPGVSGEGITGIRCHPTDPDILFVFINHIYNSGFETSTKITTDGGLTWNNFGPHSITRINNVYFIPENHNEILLVGGAFEHIYKSFDGGQTWKAKMSGGYQEAYYDYFVQSPWNPEILYCCTGSVFESQDDGETWNRTCPLKNYNSLDYYGYVFPDNTDNMIFMENESGSFWSENGGLTWNPGFGFSGSITRGVGLISQDVSSNVVYTTADDMSQNPSIFKSSDLGRTWKTLAFPETIPMYVSCSNSTANKLYVVYKDPENENTSHVKVSTDAGNTWTELNLPDNNYYVEIQDSPCDSDLILVIGICPEGDEQAEYIFRSENGGQSFEKIGPNQGQGNTPTTFPRDFLREGGSFYFHPQNPNILYGGYTDSFISYDSGKTWISYPIQFSIKKQALIQKNNLDTIISKGMISRDSGVIWSRLGYFLGAIKFWNDDVVISDTKMKMVRLDDQAPRIACGGFGSTRLVTNIDSEFNSLIYVVDPCIYDHIDHLELCIDGMPIGYEIKPDSSDDPPNWSLFDLMLTFIPGTAGTGIVEYRAVDSFGNLGPLWPSLSIR